MIDKNTIDLMEKTGIQRYLDVSTAHITKEDYNLLRKIANNFLSDVELIVDEHIFGYHVQRGNISDDPDLFKHVLTEVGFSEAFIDIMFAANRLDCVFVNFDRDGLKHEGLPRFDW